MKNSRLIQTWNDNLSIKALAFFVAFVFWVVMLGRQDISVTKDLSVQVFLPPKMELVNSIPKQVTIEITGPRISLTRYTGRQDLFLYTLDLSSLRSGYHQVVLGKRGIDLPVGIDLLAIKPGAVDVVLQIAQKPDVPAKEEEL